MTDSYDFAGVRIVRNDAVPPGEILIVPPNRRLDEEELSLLHSLQELAKRQTRLPPDVEAAIFSGLEELYEE